MSNREQVAKELATKDGRQLDGLNEVLKKAYLHNADCAIADREQIAAEAALAAAPKDGKAQVVAPTCPICKGIEWLSPDVPCHECNPVGLNKVEEPEADESLGEVNGIKIKRAAKKGEYYCGKCLKFHIGDKKLGQRHLKHRLISVPFEA